MKSFPIATLCLMVVSISMMAVIACKCGTLDPTPALLVQLGANIDSLTMRGQFWRLITSAFLHADIEHIAFNMVSLFSIGVTLEKIIGSINILCIYLLSAVSGGLLSVVFHENVACVGASGAIFGLFGATITYLVSAHRRIGIDFCSVIGYMKSGVVMLVINFLYSLLPDIDMAGHVGGLLGGLVLGFIVGIPVNGAIIGTIIATAVLSVSWLTGKDADRLTVRELSQEVGAFLKENLIKEINKDGESNSKVNIDDIILVHDEGVRYHGFVKIRYNVEGDDVIVLRQMSVTYDGESYSYEIKE